MGVLNKTKLIIGIGVVAVVLIIAGVAQKPKETQRFSVLPTSTSRAIAKAIAPQNAPKSKKAVPGALSTTSVAPVASATGAVSEIISPKATTTLPPIQGAEQDVADETDPETGVPDTNAAPVACPQNNLGMPTHAIAINEIAWAGIGKDQTSREWIELKNDGDSDVPLAGWQLLSVSEGIKIFFGESDIIPTQGFFLLERGSEDGIPGLQADKAFTGAIKNSDESLRLFDQDCLLIDDVLADDAENGAWPAGTASPDYRTAERSSDLSWHTYSGNAPDGLFGTPRAENSPEAVGPAPPPIVTPTSSATSTSISTSSSQAAATSSLVTDDSSTTSSTTSSSSPPLLMITEVMAGMQGNDSYEFIELYNPGPAAIDLGDWTIKKKSSTGNESALVSASRLAEKAVPAGKYFLLANQTGYTGTVTADAVWPASYLLAYKTNAITLYGKNGEAIDTVAWDEIPAGQSFTRSSLSGSGEFNIRDPTPQNSSG